jgi:hypothetical protein
MSSIHLDPADLQGLEAAGEAALNAALSRLSPAERDAYWASVRRCYNAPYNDAAPKVRTPQAPPGREEARAG